MSRSKHEPSRLPVRTASIIQVERGILVFLLVLLVGTVGYESISGWSFLDSLYMTVITIFSVGYQEVQPLSSTTEKIFTMGLIIAGSSAAVYIAGGFVKVFAEGEINRAIGSLLNSKNVENMQDHTIICGYGRLGRILADQLTASGSPFIIVDKEDSRLQEAEERGFVTLRGEAEDEEVLRKAGIERARFLASVLPNDAINVFITLTARNLRKDIRIIARGENPATEKKLYQAGADEVVMPAIIGGLRIAHHIMHPSFSELLGVARHQNLLSEDLHQLGLDIEEFALGESHGMAGKTLLTFRKLSEGRFIVLAIRSSDGTMLQNPPDDYILKDNDALMVVSAHGKLSGPLVEVIKTRTELL